MATIEADEVELTAAEDEAASLAGWESARRRMSGAGDAAHLRRLARALVLNPEEWGEIEGVRPEAQRAAAQVARDAEVAEIRSEAEVRDPD